MKKTKIKIKRRYKSGGHPPKYNTPEELQAKIDEYFNIGVAYRSVLVGPPNHKTVEKILVPTITGLVLYCGFCDRRSFYDTEKREGFSHTIKTARTRIEQNYEELLQAGGGSGAIFALKNFGWRDIQEIGLGISDNLMEKYKDLDTKGLIAKLNDIIGD